MRHAVFAFCSDLNKDPAAAHVLAALKAECPLAPTDIVIDDRPVLRTVTAQDVMLSIVTTSEVISHDYQRYAPIFNHHFSTTDVIGIVNWHEGANAPNAIFTVQTTGDMASGTFSPVDPHVTRGLLLAIESERRAAGLDAFQTFAEATHWSGVMHGDPGTRLAEMKSSAIDIEIGSSPTDWTNPGAARVLARALLRTFERIDEPVQSVLCIGGIHFESSFTRAVFEPREGLPIAISHILPNHWLVAHGYDREERLPDLLACIRSIRGGIQGLVHHDKLKAPYKAVVRRLGEELRVPVYSHKRLRANQNASL
jgi:D-tyrosyl-tRNA(Tyr) deacylase